MCEAAVEEVSILSAIYCGQGEFQLLQQSEQDGFLVQINTSTGGDRALQLSLLFHLHPQYPSCPPDISVSSTAFSRTQCHNIRQKLLDQAATLSPEPMVHQLVEWIQHQDVEETKDSGAEEVKDRDREERWTAVLSLDHIRSRSRYVGLLQGWSQQLRLTGRLLMGRTILIILQGARADIKEFCCLLKTVKVDVDSSGRKCKERMMKVLMEAPSPSSSEHGLPRFVVVDYQSSAELSAVFQELHIPELYQQILPSLRGK